MPWLIILFSLYVIYCGLLFFFQTKLIFPASMAGQARQAMPTADTEVIELTTDEGTTAAWFVPAPKGIAKEPAPLAMFFHGNAELIDDQRGIIDLYHSLGVHVLLVEYRGYGHSEGTPSEKNIVADSVAVLGQVLEREQVDAGKFVLHGRSIGGGLAAQVALQTEPTALVVESTFTSVSGMAMRFGVPPFIVTSPLKSEEAFKDLSIPILIMHGQRDSIVPVVHAHALNAAANDATLVLFDADHNTLPEAAQVDLYKTSVAIHLAEAGLIDVPEEGRDKP